MPAAVTTSVYLPLLPGDTHFNIPSAVCWHKTSQSVCSLAVSHTESWGGGERGKERGREGRREGRERGRNGRRERERGKERGKVREGMRAGEREDERGREGRERGTGERE